ncbi:expressed unknown protein [Seminavis robusta]|uniref:Uncharacterized protein n=1 Tax=Seminavis robusta TaxID=568900 RepID=A0A9N8EYH8_9STRA|nr:expressed unknown protein [Seminavis robusta]|eukprot:Sro2555_g331110.1 n/a (207) ;mRNA; r:1523-2143
MTTPSQFNVEYLPTKQDIHSDYENLDGSSRLLPEILATAVFDGNREILGEPTSYEDSENKTSLKKNINTACKPEWKRLEDEMFRVCRGLGMNPIHCKSHRPVSELKKSLDATNPLHSAFQKFTCTQRNFVSGESTYGFCNSCYKLDKDIPLGEICMQPIIQYKFMHDPPSSDDTICPKIEVLAIYFHRCPTEAAMAPTPMVWMTES